MDHSHEAHMCYNQYVFDQCFILKCLVLSTTQRYLVYGQGREKKPENINLTKILTVRLKEQSVVSWTKC